LLLDSPNLTHRLVASARKQLGSPFDVREYTREGQLHPLAAAEIRKIRAFVEHDVAVGRRVQG